MVSAFIAVPKTAENLMTHTHNRQRTFINKEWSKESKKNNMDLRCSLIGNLVLPIRIQMRILLLFLLDFLPPRHLKNQSGRQQCATQGKWGAWPPQTHASKNQSSRAHAWNLSSSEVRILWNNRDHPLQPRGMAPTSASRNTKVFTLNRKDSQVPE